jgi:hypothetical protein
MEQVLRSNFTLIDAHFIDKIKNKISRTHVPVGGTCKHNLYCQEDLSQYHLTLNTICPSSMNKSKIIKTIKPLLIPKAVHVTENTFEENLLIFFSSPDPQMVK